MGKERIGAVRCAEGRLERNGWRDSRLWGWWRGGIGGMEEWCYMMRGRASLRRDLGGAKRQSVDIKVVEVKVGK